METFEELMADELYFVGVAPEDDPTAVVRELVEGGATKRVTEANKGSFRGCHLCVKL